jgi:excinuclease ABC subunit C
MRDLALMLGLPETPESAGAFDVSNVSGAEAVGAFVFFEGGTFHKERYRHLRIETVTGADDYAMMRETVERVLGDPEAVPDIVVIDGGRGHLDTALGVVGRMARAGAFPGGDPPAVISVAKDPDRAFTVEGREIPLDVRRPAGAFLTRLRDEVHRFAVAYHRKLRGRRALDSPLMQVPGIGKKRRLALLRAMGSVEAVRRATVEELAAVPGMTRPAALALRRALDEPSGPVVQ